MKRSLVAAVLLGLAPGTWAQGAHGGGAPAAPSNLTQAEKAARRFPQPVRVGDLTGRQVLEPSQHQGVLGRVDGVWREPGGALKLAFRYGGLLGWGTRTIAVPVDATALLGQFVQVTDVDEAQLRALPTWTGAGAAALGPDDVIRVGVTRN